MSDITQTNILRGFLAALAMLGILIVVVIADHIFDKITGMNGNSFIEGVVFLIVTFEKVWGWVSRRVWIGSLPPPQS